MTAPSRIGGVVQDVRNGFELVNNGGAGNRYGEMHGKGNFVEREDGRMLICYTSRTAGSNRKVMLSLVDSITTIAGVSNSAVTEEWELLTLNNAQDNGYLRFCYFLKLPRPPKVNPDDPLPPAPILLFVFDSCGNANSGTSTLKVYRSANGLGDDFALLSNIDSKVSGATGVFGWDYRGITLPVQMVSGRIVIGYMIDKAYAAGYTFNPIHFAYSDNNGSSWTIVIPDGINIYYTLPGSIAVFGEQLAVMMNNYDGGGTIRYTLSSDSGASWTPLSGVDTLPGISAGGTPYWYGSSVVQGRFVNDGSLDGFNYMVQIYTSAPMDARLYRRRAESSIPAEAPSLSGWEGPLNIDIPSDDYVGYIATVKDESGKDDPYHVLGATSHFGAGSIFYVNIVKEFKTAIVAIADQVIRSTFPLVRMFLVFAHRLDGGDHLEFKLVSPLETITSYDDGDGYYVAGRFAFSYDGGARWIKWPTGGVPCTNPWGLLVAANIQVPPGRSVTLTPYVRIFEGSGRDKWWELEFRGKPNWMDIGLDFGKGEAFEPSFEHETTGLP